MNILDAYQVHRPLVFGHRGASACAPMNTLPAFQLAADQGADGIELDVRLTGDGFPVILHDPDVDHTTNGKGSLREYLFLETQGLDAGSWFSAEFRGTPLPTLGDVFERLGQHLFINVEIKSEAVETDGVEAAVAATLRQFQMQGRVLVSSFNPLALRRFHALLPEVPLGFLVAPDTLALAAHLGDLPLAAWHPQHDMLDEDEVQRLHALGYRVNAWTVNDPERMRTLIRWGVDGLITDYPDRAKALVQHG